MVKAARPFSSILPNTAEDSKCPSSSFDNAVFFPKRTTQNPIFAINWSFIGESAVVRAHGRERQCRRERKKVWPLLRWPLAAGAPRTDFGCVGGPTVTTVTPAAWISTADKPKDEHHVAVPVLHHPARWEVGTGLSTHIMSPHVEGRTTSQRLSAPDEYRYHHLPRQHTSI